MIKTNRLLFYITIALISIGMFMPALTSAGSLEPTAAPAPTTKTLAELKPGTPIPGSSTAADTYVISESGYYYLAGDRVASIHGIEVTTDNVTIDLMGYSLIGSAVSSSYGVDINGCSNVEIKNGTVRNFFHGIYDGSTADQGHRVMNVRSTGNIGYGIYISAGNSLVRGCTVSDNGTSAPFAVYGIRVGEGGTVTDNLVYNNATGCTAYSLYIIYAGFGSIVRNNVARNNGSNAAYSGGYLYIIYADSSSTVINNIVSSNGESSGDTVIGIGTGVGCTISGNSSYYNGYGSSSAVHGIYCGNGSTVIENTASYNGLAGTGTAAGITLMGSNLVDQNTAFNNNSENIAACATCTFGTNHPAP